MDSPRPGPVQLQARVAAWSLRSPLYCPFLRPILGDGPWSYGSQPSCRLPSGRVRGIAPREFERFCVAGRYHDCAGYQFWRQSVPRLP